MRWEQLFGDLEAQFDAAREAEFAAEVADRSRREVGVVRLVDRLRPAVGQVVTARLVGADVVEGRLASVGPDWLLLAEIAGREALLPVSGVLALGGLAAQTAPADPSPVASRLTFAFALRGIVRDRLPVSLGYRDGTATTGTLDRVGADFVEIAEHSASEPRRRGVVRAVKTVPLESISFVRRA